MLTSLSTTDVNAVETVPYDTEKKHAQSVPPN